MIDNAISSATYQYIDSNFWVVYGGGDGESRVLLLNGVSGTDANGQPASFTDGTTSIHVIMDSGTTFTLLPQALATSIWAFVCAAPYSNDLTTAYILCSAGQSIQTINFSFNGITIAVPLSQLVVFPDSNNVWCTFGIAIDSVYIIGDSVLTAMYVVYDLDNKQISLAPTVFNSVAPENILQILAGSGGVPTMAKVSSPSVGLSISTSSSSVSSSSISQAASSSSGTTVSSSTISSHSSCPISAAAFLSSNVTLSSSTTMSISSSLNSTLSPAACSSTNSYSSTTMTTSSSSSSSVSPPAPLTLRTSTTPTITSTSTTPTKSLLLCNRVSSSLAMISHPPAN